MADKSICSVDGCSKAARAGGMCSGHYHKLKRHGDPLTNIRVPRGLAEDFFHNVVLPYQGDDCLIWPYGRTQSGYGRMTLDGKRGGVHRFACERVHGIPISPDLHAAHECGNGHLGCVNPKHLSWKTQLENKADELVHGTRNMGSRNGRAKLTEEEARAILAMKRAGLHSKYVAAQFGVCQGTVNGINAGRNWSCLQE